MGLLAYADFFIIPFLLCSLISFSSSSADLNKGLLAYENGDYETALQEWTPLAEQGEASAQTFLGLMYDNGYGILQNYRTAVKWFTLAAEQGHAGA